METGYTYYYKTKVTINIGNGNDTIEQLFTGFSCSDKWQAKQRAKAKLNKYLNNPYIVDSQLIDKGYKKEC